MREELELKYKRDIKIRDELIELLKAKVSEGYPKLHSGEHTVSIINGRESCSSGGGSNEPEAVEDLSCANRLKLPAFPKFSGDDRDDVHSLKRWLAKLEKHAELQCWMNGKIWSSLSCIWLDVLSMCMRFCQAMSRRAVLRQQRLYRRG